MRYFIFIVYPNINVSNELYAVKFFSWRGPRGDISSIDENSISTDAYNFSVEGHRNHMIYPKSQGRSPDRLLVRSTHDTSSKMPDFPNNSPPLSDLTPLSLPYLGSNIPHRAVSVIETNLQPSI